MGIARAKTLQSRALRSRTQEVEFKKIFGSARLKKSGVCQLKLETRNHTTNAVSDS